MEGNDGSLLDLAGVLGQMMGGHGRSAGGEGFGGMGILVLIILFFFVAVGGGGGFFGRNREPVAVNGNYVTQEDLAAGFNQQNTMRALNSLGEGLGASSYNNLDMLHSINNNITQNINSLSSNMLNCCCETNRNIDSVRFQIEQAACGIKSQSSADTQRILDRLCDMEKSAKDSQINTLQLQLAQATNQIGNMTQTQNVLNSIGRYMPYTSGGFCCNNNPCGPCNVV